jgi:hypothetical protein
MAPRLTKKERHAASSRTVSYLPTQGPGISHHRQKIPSHIRNRPEIYLANGRTLVQPHLPPLLGHVGFTEFSTCGRTHMVTRPEKDVEENLRSEPDLWEPDRTPPPSPSKHGRKRVAQWQRWQTEVIPNLIPHYIDVLYESKSLRDLEKLVPQSTACNCVGHTRKITIIRFSCTWAIIVHCSPG